MAKIQKLKIIILLSTLFFILPNTSTFAADLFFEATTNEVQVGRQFEIKIFVNTQEESANAF